MKLSIDLHNMLVPGKIELNFQPGKDGDDPIIDIKELDLVGMDNLLAKFHVNELVTFEATQQ